MEYKERNCLICGVKYKPLADNQKYCSDCKLIAKKCDMSKPCVCKVCGKQFYKHRNAKGIYCSQECSRADPSSPQFAVSKQQHQEALVRKALLEQERRYNKMINALIKALKNVGKAKQRDIDLTRVCKECGRTFKARSYREWYCSMQCRRRSENRYSEKRICRNGKPDLSITLPKLFVRDNGVCQACGRHCDWNDYEIVNDSFITRDGYPSIDHIKPLSKGGLHSWDNVQLLCFRCNRLKRDKY